MNRLLLQAAGGSFMDQIGQFLPMIAIAVVFYFFMIRPQMKRSKEAKSFRENLGIGDKIITSGGIHGKVLEVSDTTILISSEGTKLRIEKSSISPNSMDQLGNQQR